MKTYPAIDILEGKCVRLKQGDFEKATVYGDDPEKMARAFQNAGFQEVHVVDLSGARDPRRRQVSLLSRLIHSFPALRFQVGGGIRTLAEVQDLLEHGVDRVVLGSIAIQNPTLTQTILQEVDLDRITLALDVREDTQGVHRVSVHGWLETGKTLLSEVLQEYYDRGVRRVLCTDITRDGMLAGPNFDLYQSLLNRFPDLRLQASGGVRSLDDITRLEAIGLDATIVGRALYDNLISLQDGSALC